MPIATKEEVKAYLGIADTTQDALIDLVLPAVIDLITQYCDTDFDEVTKTGEIIDGQNTDVIVLDNFPVTEVIAVYLGVDTKGENGLLLEDTQYYVDDDGSIILRNVQTPFMRGSVRVDYKHGYAAVPPSVKLCAIQATKAEMQRKKRGTEDISSRSKDGESESYGSAWDKKTGLPVQIMSKLEQFRVKEFPNAGMAQRNQ